MVHREQKNVQIHVNAFSICCFAFYPLFNGALTRANVIVTIWMTEWQGAYFLIKTVFKWRLF